MKITIDSVLWYVYFVISSLHSNAVENTFNKCYRNVFVNKISFIAFVNISDYNYDNIQSNLDKQELREFKFFTYRGKGMPFLTYRGLKQYNKYVVINWLYEWLHHIIQYILYRYLFIRNWHVNAYKKTLIKSYTNIYLKKSIKSTTTISSSFKIFKYESYIVDIKIMQSTVACPL